MDISVSTELPVRPPRKFLPEGFKLSTWDFLAPYYQALLDEELSSAAMLENWLIKWSELDSVVGEEIRWRYVNTSTDTNNEEAKKALEEFQTQIAPKQIAMDFQLLQKLLNCPHTNRLDQEEYRIYLRGARKKKEIFRAENIPFMQEIALLNNNYDVITGKMSIVHEGKEMSLAQAANFQKSPDRALREKIYRQVVERRIQDSKELNDLMDNLLMKRNQVSKNAGYKNFRDYQFDALGRFDYTADDCFRFHAAIEKVFKPILNKQAEKRRKELGLEVLRPWDMDVDVKGREALKPFSTVNEFLEKTITCLNRVDPYFGSRLNIMNEMKYLDLEARVGKAAGGYNMGMPEMGVPFIFMNASMSESDIRVLTHEAGHAVHSFLSHPLKINEFKEFPSEVAELASMSMELFGMTHWDVFFDNAEDLKAARKRHLEGIFATFSSVSVNDSFQHWMYENPDHIADERCLKYAELYEKYNNDVTEWEGLEKFKAHNWQRIMHVYHMPFYYIEYAFAQLGAVAMYKQFKSDPVKAIANYKKALSLGYTKSIGEIYEAAGIRFDFSEAYVSEIVGFLAEEYEALG